MLELGIPVVVALNKSDINEKKETKIDTEALSEKLGCPVIKTVSTETRDNGLSEVVKAAVSVCGRGQKAPYEQGDMDLSNKAVVEAADRKRYAFVNKIVSEVETRKVFTKDVSMQDKIDNVLTNKWLGIPIFAVIMFVVFDISQSTFGPFLADILVGWIETFQEWAGEMISGASPFLQALLVDGIIWRCWSCSRISSACNGNVFPDRTSGRLWLYGARVGSSRPDLQESRTFGQIGDPYGNRNRLRDSGYHGMPYDPKRKRAQSHGDADTVYAMWSETSCHCIICGSIFCRCYMGGYIDVFCRDCPYFLRGITGKKNQRI